MCSERCAVCTVFNGLQCAASLRFAFSLIAVSHWARASIRRNHKFNADDDDYDDDFGDDNDDDFDDDEEE